MPRNQFQRMAFAFLTVLVTVHGYVFYSLYVVNGNILMQLIGADSVLHAIDIQGGVYMFGRMLPLWVVIFIEFCCAYALECLVGSTLSFRMACKMFHPGESWCASIFRLPSSLRSSSFSLWSGGSSERFLPEISLREPFLDCIGRASFGLLLASIGEKI